MANDPYKLELIDAVEETVENITTQLADKITELNGGKTVSAVFVVGGGGKIAGFTEKLAVHLGLAKERVALRGQEVMQNIEFKAEGIKKDSLLVDVGKNLIKGFIKGIKSMAQGVIDSVTGVVGGAIDWAKNLLDINSPSRVFKEIGQYVGEGFVVGIDSYSNKVASSAGDLAESVIRNVKDPLSNIYKLLDDNIDVNPTIRPVMDLSNIENGTRLLNDMLGDQRIGLNASSVRLAGTVGKIQNGTNNKDIVDALKDLKEGMNNGPSYTINGITYDDGSNVSAAVQTLVRAAKIERRL